MEGRRMESRGANNKTHCVSLSTHTSHAKCTQGRSRNPGKHIILHIHNFHIWNCKAKSDGDFFFLYFSFRQDWVSARIVIYLYLSRHSAEHCVWRVVCVFVLPWIAVNRRGRDPFSAAQHSTKAQRQHQQQQTSSRAQPYSYIHTYIYLPPPFWEALGLIKVNVDGGPPCDNWSKIICIADGVDCAKIKSIIGYFLVDFE